MSLPLIAAMVISPKPLRAEAAGTRIDVRAVVGDRRRQAPRPPGRSGRMVRTRRRTTSPLRRRSGGAPLPGRARRVGRFGAPVDAEKAGPVTGGGGRIGCHRCLLRHARSSRSASTLAMVDIVPESVLRIQRCDTAAVTDGTDKLLALIPAYQEGPRIAAVVEAARAPPAGRRRRRRLDRRHRRACRGRRRDRPAPGPQRRQGRRPAARLPRMPSTPARPRSSRSTPTASTTRPRSRRSSTAFGARRARS